MVTLELCPVFWFRMKGMVVPSEEMDEVEGREKRDGTQVLHV